MAVRIRLTRRSLRLTLQRSVAGADAATSRPRDATTIQQTLEEAQSAAREFNPQGVEEVVADKGYHSGTLLQEVHAQEVRNAGGGSGAKGRPKSRSGRMRIGDGYGAHATSDCKNCGAN